MVVIVAVSAVVVVVALVAVLAVAGAVVAAATLAEALAVLVVASAAAGSYGVVRADINIIEETTWDDPQPVAKGPRGAASMRVPRIGEESLDSSTSIVDHKPVKPKTPVTWPNVTRNKPNRNPTAKSEVLIHRSI